MVQNRSSAVMQQRREPHDSLDDFPTPPWATRALCEFIVNETGGVGMQRVREPAANRGHMVRPLRDYFETVIAADVHDYGAGFEIEDYLFGFDPHHVDWTITNPPFRLAEQFIARAMATSHEGVAMLVRSAFLEGVGRYQRLFGGKNAPTHVLQFSERVVMHRGRLAPEGSTATAYCWVVWFMDRVGGGTRLEWIPPCRQRLTLPGDYELPA